MFILTSQLINLFIIKLILPITIKLRIRKKLLRTMLYWYREIRIYIIRKPGKN